MRLNGTYFIRPFRIFLHQRVTPIYSRTVLLFVTTTPCLWPATDVCVCVCVNTSILLLLDAFRAPFESNKIFFDMFYYRNQKCTQIGVG